MFMTFSSQVVPVLLTNLSVMSAREDAKRVVVGTVVRRRNEDVVSEMAGIATEERRRMAAQTAQALPRTPPQCVVMWSRLRPIRHQRPINPVPPPTPEEARVAAVRQRELEAGEAYLLEEGTRLANRPRSPTPPRKADDHYDLAKWSRQRWH